MGYFSNIANAAFKDNPEGDGWIFYPQGLFKQGKGRIVTSEKQKNRLFYFQKYSIIITLVVGVTYGLYFSKNGVKIHDVIEIIIILVIMGACQYLLIKDLPQSNIVLTNHERMSKIYKDKKAWSLYLYFLLNISLILMGISMPWVLDKPFVEIYDFIIMVICLGILGIAIGLQRKKYIKSNK